MASNEPFGFDPDDLDRFFPGVGDQLRGALGQFARMLNAPMRAEAGTACSMRLAALVVRHPAPKRPVTPARVCG